MADVPKVRMEETNITLLNAVQYILGRTPIVSFGIIKGVTGNLVKVALSVYTDKNRPQIINCVYCNLASSNFAFNFVPKVNDKVLVLFTQCFSPSMFDTDKTEPEYKENANGYNYLSGIALSVNQFDTDRYTKYLETSEDGFTLKTETAEIVLDKDGKLKCNLSYDSNAEKYRTQIVADNEQINVSTDNTQNKINSIVLKKGTGISIQDDNGNKMSMTSSGITIEDKNSKKIEMSSSGTVINGKLKVL